MGQEELSARQDLRLSRLFKAPRLLWLFLTPTLILAGTISVAQDFTQRGAPPRVNNPVNPVKLLGNIYYVGMSDNTSYLITTPEGNILIDATSEETVPLIRASIEKLGFKMRDIKIMLNSHGHADHIGGEKLMQELTGAQVWISEPDAPVLTAGGRGIKAMKPDRVFGDGQQVILGGVTLTANFTPGHTKGCTTWTMEAEDGGKKYNVVFWCGLGGLNLPLLNNPRYPNLAQDAAYSVQIAKLLPCDVYFGPHTENYGMLEKLKKLEQGGPNPFIDPQGCRTSVEEREKQLQVELKKERAAAH